MLKSTVFGDYRLMLSLTNTDYSLRNRFVLAWGLSQSYAEMMGRAS